MLLFQLLIGLRSCSTTEFVDWQSKTFCLRIFHMDSAVNCIETFDAENNALASVQPQEEVEEKGMATSSNVEQQGEEEEKGMAISSSETAAHSEILEVEWVEEFDSYGVPTDVRHRSRPGKA